VKPYERVIGISCKQLVDYCMDYLSGSLPAEERESFDGHLAYCPECVKFFHTYKKTPAFRAMPSLWKCQSECAGRFVTFSASATRVLPELGLLGWRLAWRKKSAPGCQVSQAARLTDGATRARLRH
jgi:anti-sigma factor RsiW